MSKLDIICSGEPLVAFNERPDGRGLTRSGADVPNREIASMELSGSISVPAKQSREPPKSLR